MQLIHTATDREVVIALDAHYDLMSAGLLLDGDTDQEDAENERRIDLFTDAYRDTLAEIGRERNLTIYLGDDSEATRTPAGQYDATHPQHLDEGDTLERLVWQEAHDRTPAESLWAEASA